jgi:beta-glucosidase
MKKITIPFLFMAICLLTQNLCSQNTPFVLIKNKGGQTLGYSNNSGIKILTINGLSFKDLNKNGTLDKYEDWRLSADIRAKDLASKLSIEQIAGLMLYSRHQAIPARSGGFMGGTYNGKPFKAGEIDPSVLTDQQKIFLEKDNLRHVLITTVQSPDIAAIWNNNIQSFCEGIGMGIPANNSSDPRHGTVSTMEYNAGAGGRISMWPSSLGMAALFDPSVVERFGQVAAIEYRALGIATALSPQVDIATEPRWNRFSGTFGENPQLSAALAQAYCNGFQTSYGEQEIKDGWGFGSVNAMVKHWPGGGSGESGRDAHMGFGKFAVYPSGQFATHFIPFTEGAFKLKGKTKMASAVMPYYTISWNQDTKNKENVGNAYNSYIINDLLRKKYKYDGVACTDWGITGDKTQMDNFTGGKPHGVENLTIAQRHYKVLMAGVDQFGGNNEAAPILEAYQMGIKEHGEKWMRALMEQSAVRLLKNIFRVGLFENPYADIDNTKKTVGKPEFMKEGYETQLKSIVLLKNKGQVLPIKTGKTVYIPKKFTPASRNFMGEMTPEKLDYPVNIALVKKYFTVTDNADEADFAIAFIQNPSTGSGYDSTDIRKGGNGYVPISLQYGAYTAEVARPTSLAGGDPMEKSANRGYQGKTVKASNYRDLDMVTETYAKMKGKPVIVSIALDNPMVVNELEKQADAILVNFRVQDQALLDIISGKAEPSGLLPMQMPSDMTTVEKQAEDAPQDMKCHTDTEGGTYDFGFGRNWKDVIKDARTARFVKAVKQVVP